MCVCVNKCLNCYSCCCSCCCALQVNSLAFSLPLHCPCLRPSPFPPPSSIHAILAVKSSQLKWAVYVLILLYFPDMIFSMCLSLFSTFSFSYFLYSTFYLNLNGKLTKLSSLGFSNINCLQCIRNFYVRGQR